MPKRVINSAVKRNRMKRLIKAALKNLSPETNRETRGIVVVVANLAHPTLQKVTRELDVLLRKLGVLRKS